MTTTRKMTSVTVPDGITLYIGTKGDYHRSHWTSTDLVLTRDCSKIEDDDDITMVELTIPRDKIIMIEYKHYKEKSE
jgi:hypothetical protein